MSTCHFIFKPGLWLGTGKFSFTGAKEELIFYTKWTIASQVEGQIHAFQQVEMQSAPEHGKNTYRFSNFTETSFLVEMENEHVGIVQGNGFLSPSEISWEFDWEGFKGFETYTLTPEKEEYVLHAEYFPAPGFQTFINGRLWQKI